MPNFDGTGPLKRGRMIGRGRGPCRQCTEDCTQKAENRKTPVRNETVKE
ncbi:DUF5320 family protein [Methanoregula sp.]|jgi:hypothetical protein